VRDRIIAKSVTFRDALLGGRRLQTLALTLAAVLAVTAIGLPAAGQSAPHRAFSASSYWNQPLPTSVPIDPDSAKILEFLKNDSTTNYIRLAGTSSSGNWGNPIYWAGADDPTRVVKNICSSSGQPPEFQSVRIPRGARPDSSTDKTMTVYDVEKGIVYGFFKASVSNGVWSSCGGVVYYLASNGLVGRLPESDEPRNYGHRGVPPPTYAVRYDEVSAGAIEHVLKISVHHAADEYVFPMTGHESGSSDPYAPPEGTRIRIKQSVNLSLLGLSPAALVVARALQKYGALIGDQSAGPINLKVENTVAERRGYLWKDVLTTTSLSRIRLNMFEVIRLGYPSGPRPSPSASVTPSPSPSPSPRPTPSPTVTPTP
jgi:hypothetical protein